MYAKDEADAIAEPRLETWRGRPIVAMSREELIDALNSACAHWRSLIRQNRDLKIVAGTFFDG